MESNCTFDSTQAAKLWKAHQKPGLTTQTRYLVSIHALTALGEENLLEHLMDMALDQGVTLNDIREILLQTHLFCGFPRAINGFARLHRCLAARDGKGPHKRSFLTDPHSPDQWRERGEDLFQRIYLKNHSQVKESLRQFHPELPEWILNTAYGKVLSRPGLEAKIRELAAVGTLTVLRVFPQLLSHIKGGLHLGADADEVKEAILQMELYSSRDTVSKALRILMAGTRKMEK